MKYGFCLVFAVAFNCWAQVDIPETDLGEAGNLYVQNRFVDYQKGAAICAPPKAYVRRVLLTGFAPFFGRKDNPSSEILQHFGDFQKPAGEIDTYGVTREIKIRGVEYQVCFLVVPTMWDLAAAITITEMQSFKPRFVMMSGLGASDLAFETGNLNHATFSGGFDIDGNAVESSTPQANYVLPPLDPGVPKVSLLTWNAPAARRAVRRLVTKMGFTTDIPKAGHPDNDYICNNIGFVVSTAAQNTKVKLAGGAIELQLSIKNVPKIGFLHYPSSIQTDSAALDTWTEIVKRIIRSQLR